MTKYWNTSSRNVFKPRSPLKKVINFLESSRHFLFEYLWNELNSHFSSTITKRSQRCWTGMYLRSCGKLLFCYIPICLQFKNIIFPFFLDKVIITFICYRIFLVFVITFLYVIVIMANTKEEIKTIYKCLFFGGRLLEIWVKVLFVCLYVCFYSMALIYMFISQKISIWVQLKFPST